MAHVPDEAWDVRARLDRLNLERGILANPYHWPTELLTLEQIIERYGISQEDVDKLKQIINGNKTEDPGH